MNDITFWDSVKADVLTKLQILSDVSMFDSDVEIIHKPLGRHHRRDFDAFQRLTSKGVPFSKKLLDMYGKELFISGEEEDFEKAEKFFRNIFQEERSVDEYKKSINNRIVETCHTFTN